MKPTKKQRVEIYWAVMFEIIGIEMPHGVCYAVFNATNGQYRMLDLPELKRLMPFNIWKSYPYWFPEGRCKKERLALLDKAIDACK